VLRRQIRCLPVLAALALLILQTAAFAHEIEHDLEQHDEPACALHLYTGQAGKPAGTDAIPIITITPTFYTVIPNPHAPRSQRLPAYRGRAPPPLLPLVS
jgi:hypothetical protein